jgi:predicted MPP superfamily phosphohydrolase
MAVKSKSKLPSILGFLSGLGAVLGLYSYFENKNYLIKRTFIPILKDPSLQVKILHISDIHLAKNQKEKVEFLNKISDLEVDFVVVTGDNITSDEDIETLYNSLLDLKGTKGSFVFGSNDYFAPLPLDIGHYFMPKNLDERGIDNENREKLNISLLTQKLEALGWTNLNNSRKIIDLQKVKLDLVGIDDYHIGLDKFPDKDPLGKIVTDISTSINSTLPSEVTSNIKTLSDSVIAGIQGKTKPKQTIKIGLTHSPYSEVLKMMNDDGREIVFAGHTHGGQIIFPFIGPIITNTDINRNHAKGLSLYNVQNDEVVFQSQVIPPEESDNNESSKSISSWLNISGGIGSSPKFPFRFLNQPEANLITLFPKME